MDAALAEREKDVLTLAANLGTAGKNARIAWGAYTGKGIYGAANPTSLNVDCYPVLVIVGSTTLTDDTVCLSIFIRNSHAPYLDVSSSEITVT